MGRQRLHPRYRPGLWVVTGIAAAGLLITLSGLRTRRPSYGILVASSADAAARTGQSAAPVGTGHCADSEQIAVRD